MKWAPVMLAAVLAGCGGAAPHRHAPQPPPVTTMQDTAKAAAPAVRWTTARLRRATVLRARPGGRALHRLGVRTEFGSRRVLSVTARRGGWLAVVTPERPNGRVGWIPARRARLAGTSWSIVVDRSARRLTLRRGRRVVRAFPVAVGRQGTPTPIGRFAITDKLRPALGSPYGCCALALTGHQTKLIAGWPGGDRLAIHATPQEATVGHAASLGCMRARTRDVRRLMRTVPVGTPVFVRA